MGKATIVDEQGEGLYTISLDYGSDVIAQRRAPIQAELDAFQIALDALVPELDAAKAAADLAKNNLDTAINALDPESIDYSIVNEASAVLAQKGQEVSKLESRQRFIKVSIANAEKRLAELDAESVTETVDAWCATYTEGVTGEVPTIEIDGEKKPVLIAPASAETGEIAPWGAADGLNTNRLAMPASATYLNTALLPGWQKWKPTYRLGVISNIDEEDGVGDVRLDDATSSAQDLDINQTPVLARVPIEYLSCGASVFEAGDRVVVQFIGQNWSQPKVIGFEKKPRPCNPWVWVSANRVEKVMGSDFVRRVTVQLDPSDLSIQNTWQFDTTRYSNGLAVQGSDTPLITTANGGVRNATTGASVFSGPSYSSFTWGDAELAIGSGRLFLTNPQTQLIYAYSWPDGDLQGTIDRPVNAINGCIDAGGGRLIVGGYDGLGGFPANHTYSYVYDARTLGLLWSNLEGVAGQMLEVVGAAITSDYAAVIIWYDDTPSTRELVVRNAATGDLIRSVTVPFAASEAATGLTIRGDDVYILTIDRRVGSGYHRGVLKFNILTGLASAPDASAANIFEPYFASDDSLAGDFGSID